jgi:hypothetical protein
MAKANVIRLQIDKEKLLGVVLRDKGMLAAVTARAVARQKELEAIGASFYSATLKATGGLLESGVQGADKPRQQIRVPLPNGASAQVNVAWNPLTARWLKDKARRGRKKYAGPHKSYGPGMFWLDTGQLRTAFAGWLPGKGKVTPSKPRIRLASGRDGFLVSHPIAFKKLSPGFLDQALRRALIAGAVAGRRGAALEALRRSSKRGGLYRAIVPEGYRPTMRPLAMRLGRAMQEQILKTLRRR